MTRVLFGLFLGLMASAYAQGQNITLGTMPVSTYLNAGVDPNGKAAAIQVDVDGYAICSDHRKPTK